MLVPLLSMKSVPLLHCAIDAPLPWGPITGAPLLTPWAQGSLGALVVVYAQPLARFSGFRVVIIGDAEHPAFDPGIDDVAALFLGLAGAVPLDNGPRSPVRSRAGV